MKVKILGNISYQTQPIVDDMVEIDDELLKRIGIDKQFDKNGNIVDFIDKNKKILELKLWFDNFYTQHEQKFRRLHTLNLLCDDGTPPIEKLTQLYEEAEIKRREIQKLEQGGDSNGFIY